MLQFEYYLKYGQSNAMLAGLSPCNIALTALWTACNFCSIKCLFVRTDCQSCPSDKEGNRIRGCKFDGMQTIGCQLAEQLLFRDLWRPCNFHHQKVTGYSETFNFSIKFRFGLYLFLVTIVYENFLSFPQCNFSLCADLRVGLYPLLNTIICEM